VHKYSERDIKFTIQNTEKSLAMLVKC